MRMRMRMKMKMRMEMKMERQSPCCHSKCLYLTFVCTGEPSVNTLQPCTHNHILTSYNPAIEASSLWTDIHFADELPPFTRCRTWIERSKNLPIDIEIDCTLHAEPSEKGSTE